MHKFKKLWPSSYKKFYLFIGKKNPKDRKYSFVPSSYISFEYNAKHNGTVVRHNYIDGSTKKWFYL